VGSYPKITPKIYSYPTFYLKEVSDSEMCQVNVTALKNCNVHECNVRISLFCLSFLVCYIDRKT